MKKRAGLGTFNGVYLPSLLTIFGVIMYLRMGQVIGSVGFYGAILIIVMATSITFLTSLSIAASSTNITVKGGGAYFLISRSFGKEIGAAIGLPLYLAQAIGIAFYVTGFVESLKLVLPGLDPAMTGIITLAALTALAYTSASLAIKIQGVILLTIIGSLVSFFMGSGPVEAEAISFAPLSFWATFALFFPAVTGIEAGVSMSGDLKDPSKSLVRGVILAVLTGLVAYLTITWRLATTIPRSQLLADPFIFQHVARWGWMVIMGLWGATLSSGLGALLGAPRTLQALAQDGVVPRFLGRGFGPKAEPRIATIFTFLASGVCIYLGRIDIIAPLLTMFFLMSYGMLNLAAGLEGFIQNPSWRPTFRVSPLISLTGALLCLMAMFMINAGVSFVALGFVLVVYLMAMKRHMASGWDDIRQGILFLFSRIAVYRLSSSKITARSWRPNFLVFTNGYAAPQNLLEFTSSITKGKGLLIIASIFSRKKQIDLNVAKEKLDSLCRLKRVQALVTCSEEDDPSIGMTHLIDNCGIGQLRPNTMVIGDALNRENRSVVAKMVIHAYRRSCNALVVLGQSEDDLVEQHTKRGEPKRIDIWWDDEHKENSELMVLLAHMHQTSKGYGRVAINIKCTVPTESARKHRQGYFEEFFANARFKATTQVLVKSENEEIAHLRDHASDGANLVLCPLRPPTPEESEAEYLSYYQSLIKAHRRIDNVVFVLSAEKVDLTELF